ncbi:NACHT domain-containing protein [Pontibacter pamirensis]|uniref:NACHT domain-containing protein n=1 Tax=Pontibacter pamirensis TaxID=2562824 RepID=UPI00138980B9|nr:hypothetical protein [Pontibacter pamirensis]
MPANNYPWQRLWLQQGTTYRKDVNGFATFDQIHWGSEHRQAFTLAQLKDVRCLVLLGEPGMGKTTELKLEADSAKDKDNENSTHQLYFSLNSRSSEEALITSLERKPEFTQWLKNDGPFYLYLDSLDEALLNIRTVLEAVTDWLHDNSDRFHIYPDNAEPEESEEVNIQVSSRKLYLRISCRSAIWHELYKEQLESIFGSKQLQVLELAPLQKKDVALAARENEIDADAFIASVIRAELAAFCADPVALEFLIQAYKSGQLHEEESNRSSIFYQGCLHLCRGVNSTYSGRATLAPEQRLRIASRIAVYTVFSNLPNIFKPSFTSIPLEDDLQIDHLVSNEFTLSSTYKDLITQERLQEVLNTGLFTLGTTESRLTWRHRTYAEYLAAWHLNELGIPIKQAIQLITSPAATGKVQNQLRETALWFTTLNKEAFDILLPTDPLTLLQGYRPFTSCERREFVKHILQLSSSFELLHGYQDYKYLDRLCYDNMASTLQSYFTDNGVNDETRRIALVIAKKCTVAELEEEYNTPLI